VDRRADAAPLAEADLVDPMTIRNRITDHRRVRAGDLLPHPHNWRTHPGQQRATLAALYREVGFARSLLAFEAADGRLTLIDGHLRRDLHPDLVVDVEVLDVTDEEARKLLLALDPLAALAGTDGGALAELQQLTTAGSKELQALWDSLVPPAPADPEPADEPAVAEQYLVLVECRDEAQQAELLGRFQAEGLSCRALIS
jgi:hypothetical protein